MSGTLFILSSPSGGGKTTLARALIESIPNIAASLSFTTRPQRADEIDGVHYQFISEERFIQLRDSGEFLEWAMVFGHYYGTSRSWVNSRLQQGLDLFLAIDWQGARQLRLSFPSCQTIFILPPSLPTLEARLRARQQDSPFVIQQRMDKAKDEMAHYTEYDYVIINEDFEVASRELMAIVMATRLRVEAQKTRHRELLSKLL